MRQSITLLFFSLFLSVPISAYALNCGGLNQPPCKVGGRAPACNKNLREVGGKCVKFIRAESMQIRHCGAVNQRPCTAKERVHACNRGLVEDVRTHRCVRQAKKIVAIDLSPQKTTLTRLSQQSRLPVNFRSTVKRIIREVDHANKLIQNISELSGNPQANMDKLRKSYRELQLVHKRLEMLESVADAEIDEAKSKYAEAKAQFKLAMRILSEHMERMTQVTQKITS